MKGLAGRSKSLLKNVKLNRRGSQQTNPKCKQVLHSSIPVVKLFLETEKLKKI